MNDVREVGRAEVVDRATHVVPRLVIGQSGQSQYRSAVTGRVVVDRLLVLLRLLTDEASVAVPVDERLRVAVGTAAQTHRAADWNGYLVLLQHLTQA